MVRGLLFKWEDSPALSHHCGFCERPLSHPGARSSCYGTHSEPCHRYHQAMFMRLRSHTCHYCRTTDEAHYRRHKKIAKGMRDVYESCGLDEWTIIPPEPEERGRLRGHDPGLADHDDTDRSISTEEIAVSKREKKDAKALARAASRSRVISQDEIIHVDSVIHSAEGLATGEEGPYNPEEMEEIERHLKYNAHVYNSSLDRRELKKYARLPDVDVDFGTEIERIFEAFRINELLKSNTRNRGLQGNELKTFLSLVEELKKAVVEDLVLVKRDALETRMRRAGYLRYTNKTAHNIVQDRYTDKDWKTGEKYSATTSSSSGVTSPDEEFGSAHSAQFDSSPTLLPTTSPTPDRRHLERVHMRVSGDDGLGQNVIEPYHAPLLPMPPASAPGKPAVQLKVVVPGAVSNDSTRRKPAEANNGSWVTVLSGKKAEALSVKPAWGMTAAGRLVATPPRPVNPWGADVCEIPNLRSIRAPAVQPPEPSLVAASEGPESFVNASKTVADNSTLGHAAVSQKKAKKYEREARRKAKKHDVQVDAIVTADVTSESRDNVVEPDRTLDLNSSMNLSGTCNDDSADVLPPIAIPSETAINIATIPVAEDEPKPKHCVAPPEISSPPFPHTVYGRKYTDWTRFERQFAVDQLTEPFLSIDSGCVHLNTCVYEINDELDCPYHKPHCRCVDPLYDECWLSYPAEDLLFSGPFNRLRAEKLFAMYQQEAHLKNRIMLVDFALIDYLQLDPVTRMLDKSRVPKRIAAEYADFAAGYHAGPLMKQEELFERLRGKNKALKRKITQKMLGKAVRGRFELKDRPFMCYCHVNIPEDGLPKNVVECSYRDCSIKFFHKACVKKLGTNKVSRWYCTECQNHMRTLAHQTLRDLGYDDVPDEEAAFEHSMELLKGKMNVPDSAVERIKERLGQMGGGLRVAGVINEMLNNMG